MSKNLRLCLWLVLFMGVVVGCAPAATPAAPPVVDPAEPAVAATESTEATEPAPAESSPWQPRPIDGVTAHEGYDIGLVISGLASPTQMIKGPDGNLWVAELGGGEGQGQGSVVSVTPAGEITVLLEGLFDPTGIAITDGYLWLALGRDVARAPIQADFTVGEIETILEDLPFNQRTNGTLTTTPDGKLLYVTSGRPAVEAGDYSDSGILWELDPASPTFATRQIATGLKNPYAHVYDSQNRLWSTEVADDVVDGGASPDELNLIVEGADYGWPECYGNLTPALSLGGDETLCATTQPPAALFPPHTTPTSILPSPWEENTFMVALWLAGDVVTVTVEDNTVVENAMTPFVEGLRRPQHLLVWGEGEVLVSDFGTGEIFLVTAQ